MLPSLVVLVVFIAVAGCCIYLSYRVGQVISPASRALAKRMAEMEAVVGRAAADVRGYLAQHRRETGDESKRLREGGAHEMAEQTRLVRRGLEDFGERLNATRVDLARDATRLREDVEGALAGMRERAREDAAELARLHGQAAATMSGQLGNIGSESARRQDRAQAALETMGLELKAAYAASASELREGARQDAAELARLHSSAVAAIAGQIGTSAGDSERRQERAAATLEAMGNDLKAIYAASVGELRERMAADLTQFRAAVAQLSQSAAGQSAQLDALDRTFRTALQESAGKQDAFTAAVGSQLTRFRDEASGQLAEIRAVDQRLEGAWGRLKGDFETIIRSLVQVGRAIDVLKNELTVKVEDTGGRTEVDGLLERVLQPDEFERDVEIEPGSNRRVAFAVRLSDNPLTRVWLPIEVLPAIPVYNEFVAATVYNDVDAIRQASEALERAVLTAAENLSARFIVPPRTLNLAVLLVPVGDVFGEIARRDSLLDSVRRTCNVVIAGPATLPTLITGLRMAFMGTSAGGPALSNGPLRQQATADGD
jgi:DNA recombination protein RmuC